MIIAAIIAGAIVFVVHKKNSTPPVQDKPTVELPTVVSMGGGMDPTPQLVQMPDGSFVMMPTMPVTLNAPLVSGGGMEMPSFMPPPPPDSTSFQGEPVITSS